MSTPNYVYNTGSLEINQRLLDPTDNSKLVNLAFSQLASTDITLTLPPATTTLVGTNVLQTLTNKAITSATNNVSANSLKTNGAAVTVSAANPPTTGQGLFASSATTGTWQSPLLTYLYRAGSMITPSLPTLKQWHGYINTSAQTATFNVTTTGIAGGPLVFADLTDSHLQVSARFDTATITDIPIASIRNVTNATGVVVVNVISPTTVLVGGMTAKANAVNSRVYLYVIGI